MTYAQMTMGYSTGPRFNSMQGLSNIGPLPRLRALGSLLPVDLGLFRSLETPTCDIHNDPNGSSPTFVITMLVGCFPVWVVNTPYRPSSTPS